MDRHLRLSVTPDHHPLCLRIFVGFRRRREVWRCRTAERTTDRHGWEEDLVEGGIVAEGRAQAGTGPDCGGRRRGWMGPGVVCSSRR